MVLGKTCFRKKDTFKNYKEKRYIKEKEAITRELLLGKGIHITSEVLVTFLYNG